MANKYKTPRAIKEKIMDPDDDMKFRPRNIEILPRNESQKTYLNILNNKKYDIVFAVGPAGTGKTMLATLYAIKQLNEGKCKKIVITRPAVSVEEKHGFLPGSLNDKMEPWMIPVLDVFKTVYPIFTIEKMIKEEVLEMAPLGFMRGRTFKDSIVIGDEMQNAVPNQTLMLLTRIGDNSRIFITGDLNQHDRGYEENGLRDFIDKYEDFPSEKIAIFEFGKEDVVRHPVIEDILEIYGD